MASKYWVGGGSTTNWDATGNTNWSDTDGGANNATLPAAADDVFMKSSANCILNISPTPRFKSFNMTGYTGTVSGGAGGYLLISPTSGTTSVILAGTFSYAGTLSIEPRGADTVVNFTSGGQTVKLGVYYGDQAGTVNLQDALTATSFSAYAGTWNSNGFAINCQNTLFQSTVAVNITNSTIICSKITLSAWEFTSSGVLTSAGSIINITGAGNFIGGGKAYNTVTFSGDGSTISGNNTFATLNVNTAGLATGLKVTIDSIQTVTNFTTNGSAGNLAKILSTAAGSHFHLTTGSAQISVDYMSIKDSTVDQVNTWYAGANSTDVSGNSGWVFTAPSLATKKTWMQRMNKNLLITMLNEEID